MSRLIVRWKTAEQWCHDVSDRRRSKCAAGREWDDDGSDSGMSLVEVLVTMMVTAVLLTITVPIVSTFVGLTDNVQSTYSSLDQSLPLSSTLPRYLRSAVEPAPPAAGVPVPPFVLYTSASLPTGYGPWSISFYSNVGDPNGPELINIAVTGTSAPYTLVMSGTPATAGTCPGVNVSGTGCTYNPAKQKIFETVTTLVNGPNSGTPIFTYRLSTSSSGTLPANPPPASNPFLTTNCTGSDASGLCPPDQINYVNITFEAKTKSGLTTEISTSLYLIVSAYSPIVG